MSIKRPSRDFWLGQVIFWFTILFILTLCGITIAFGMEKPSEGLSRPYRGIPMVQQNTLVAITAPYIVKPVVLGSIIEDVIDCESGWQHTDKYGNIIRGDAGEYGLCQFMPDTWIHFNKIRGTNLDIYSEQDQLDMINWAFKNGYQEHWTCYRNLTN